MLVSAADITLPRKGAFIVLEGVNGAGKSTLQRSICAHLTGRAIDAVATREPGATEHGRRIREILLSTAERPSQTAELLLFAADRADHVVKIIRPARARGAWVVSDRYMYSSVAFQGHGRGISIPSIEALNDLAIAGERPDLVVLIDLDPAEGLRRTAKRAPNGESDALEAEEIAFHKRVREGFLDIARRYPEPFLILDGAASPAELAAAVTGVIDRSLGGT